MPIVVFRGARRADLRIGYFGPLGIFNYGLANYRGEDVNARFTQDGYTTAGLSTSRSPIVALVYAALGWKTGDQTVVFAILISDAAFQAGSVERQARTVIYTPLNVVEVGYGRAARSVEANQEVVLPSAPLKSVIGYYTINGDAGDYTLDAWVGVSGAPDYQNLARGWIEAEYAALRARHGNRLGSEAVSAERNRLMGEA